MAASPIILKPFGPTFNVSTLTSLINGLAVNKLRRLLITLRNPDPTNRVSLFVDPSTSGVAYNTNRRQTDVALPGEECHVEVESPSLYPFIRAFAQTDDPFPVVSGVTFEVRGEAESQVILDVLLRTVAGSQAG